MPTHILSPPFCIHVLHNLPPNNLFRFGNLLESGMHVKACVVRCSRRELVPIAGNREKHLWRIVTYGDKV